jgi:hypothetical protein
MIKIQKTFDPIPTNRASWPDKAKKQTTYSGRDYQDAPFGQNLEEMLLGTMVPVGGSEGT